jgi:hypothetical protein
MHTKFCSEFLTACDHVRQYSSHGIWQCELHSYGSEHRPVTGSCRYSKKPSGRIKRTESLDWACDYNLLSCGFVPRSLLRSWKEHSLQET